MYNQYSPFGMGGNVSRIARLPRINWTNFLNNTQRTLGIINQAIPIVNQMRPLVSNARTLFKIAGAMREDTPKEENILPQTEVRENNNSNLQFFL